MASTTDSLLGADDARAILKAQETRLEKIGAKWHLAFTQRPESLLPSYDTLVIDLYEPYPPRAQRHSIENVPVVLREVLLVLQALSGCLGFSYRDNPAFWTGVFPRSASFGSDQGRFDIPKPSRSFPRVVLYCCYNQVSGFQRKVFDLFFPSRMGEPNQASKSTLERLQTHSSGAPIEPIECVVRLQLGKTASDTRDILAYVTTQLADIDQERHGSPLQLSGLELMGRQKSSAPSGGLQVTHLKPLQALFANLPQSVTLALRFRHRFVTSYSIYPTKRVTGVTPAQATGFNGFFRRACGFQGSEFAGRLEVLDLIGALGRETRSQSAHCNFASFCTLLPSTTSLQEVRVKIMEATDWLWLAYAMFHPQSHQSAWRRLVVCAHFGEAGPITNWEAVNQFVQAGTSLTAIVDFLDHGRQDYATSENHSPDEGRKATRRTATTIKQTTVYHTDKVQRLVTLARGETVAVCAIETGNSDWVFVQVPGYSFGYTSKSCLSSISESEDMGPLKSCITSLHVAGCDSYQRKIPVDDQLGILRLFGPSLKHLRVSQSNWFRQRGFSQHVPLLEVVDCCHFGPDFASEDFLALPKLRALHVVCGAPHVERCFHDLLLPCRSKLQELYLQVDIQKDKVSEVESLLKQCLGRLLHLTLDSRMDYYTTDRRPPITLGGIATKSDLDRSKLAFLSVVEYAQTPSVAESSALAQLDSSVIRQVFDFCGLRLESLIVGGNGYYGHESQTPNEPNLPGDSWFTQRSDY